MAKNKEKQLLSSTLLIGCDPEVFVRNSLTKEFVSAHGIVKGTKYEPEKVQSGALQIDGVALEFNIDPTDNVEVFGFRVQSLMTLLATKAKEANPDYILSVESIARFKPSYFNALPEETKLLGCDPDFNAYTLDMNEMPYTTLPMRTGGGHIHLGWTKKKDLEDFEHFKLCADVIKQLDCVLYPLSCFFDKDEKRRQLYGNRGAFRPKPYGVEYRTLSNKWLSDPELVRWIFQTTIKAIELFDEGLKLYEDEDLSPVDYKGHESVYWDLIYHYELPDLPKKYCPISLPVI